jgi:integrase
MIRPSKPRPTQRPDMFRPCGCSTKYRVPLDRMRKAQDRMRARLEHGGGTWPIDGLVFTTRTGRAIEPRAVSRRFDLRCAKAGVRRIRVHDTRRTCGSLLAAFDVHPRVAMRILRHSKISITMEIYTMVPDKTTIAALKRLSDALGAPDAMPPDEAD